jgi:predicted GTPase
MNESGMDRLVTQRGTDTGTEPPTLNPEEVRSFYKIAAIARDLGAESVAAEALDLQERLSGGRFYVACLGQFKRGKSTLIGALTGHDVLPTGFIPVTAVPTIVRYGETLEARITTRQQGWAEIALGDLEQYVSEQHNPENYKQVIGAEVFVPSPLLQSGMCLVDTPGLGSVFIENTAATEAFVPHIDAALVVIGADPPLSGEELDLVEAVARNAPDLIVVMNKADRTTDAERSAASVFARSLLEKRLNRNIPRIYQVSALSPRDPQQPQRDWIDLVNALAELVDNSARRLIASACERGRARLTEQLLLIISEERDALERPVHESEVRIAEMRKTVASAAQSMRDLSYLLMSDQRRISDLFLERRKNFVERALPTAAAELGERLSNTRIVFGPGFRRVAMAAAQSIARKHIMPWLQKEEAAGEEEYRRVSARFTELSNQFVARLAESGMPELGRVPSALKRDSGFRVKSKFLFRDFIEMAQPASPLRWLADVFLGVFGMRSLIEQDANRFLSWLFEVNSTRVQSDVFNRVEESRHQLDADVRRLLHEVSRIAENALRKAYDLHEQGMPAVQQELARLHALEGELV